MERSLIYPIWWFSIVQTCANVYPEGKYGKWKGPLCDRAPQLGQGASSVQNLIGNPGNRRTSNWWHSNICLAKSMKSCPNIFQKHRQNLWWQGDSLILGKMICPQCEVENWNHKSTTTQRVLSHSNSFSPPRTEFELALGRPQDVSHNMCLQCFFVSYLYTICSKKMLLIHWENPLI